MTSYQEFYEKRGDYSEGARLGDPFYKELEEFVKKWNLRDKKMLEIGSGNGTLANIVSDYTGLDVAESLRPYYKKPYFVVNEDGSYPFPNETFDFVVTYAVFEHIPDIEKALGEMLRISKKESVILFSPAWQVRPWAAQGYAVRPYSDFDWRGKLVKFSLLWRNTVIFRALFLFPERTIRTLRFLLKKGKAERLDYKKIIPNYEKMWDADSDACNHIDPHAAIIWFFAHGCRVINYPSLWRAFFVRTGALIVQKMEESHE